MQVAAQSIQLDDFPPPQRLVDEPAAPDRSAEGLRSSAGRLAGRTDRLLSAGFLRRFDANIDVQAEEVLSGADRLAYGRLHLELQRGRLSLDPTAVGRFDLQDGKLSGETMLIDTSSVRIRGAGGADLATEELAFVFRPRAKGLGLLRLQTPLRVGGTLTDQRFYFTQSDVLESVLRLIASPILLPIERLRNGPQPRDGADVCTDPLRAVAR